MSNLHNYLPYLFGNKKGQQFSLPPELDWGKLNFEELLMFHALKDQLEMFLTNLTISHLSPLEVFHLFSFHEYLPKSFLENLCQKYSHEWQIFLEATKNHQELDKNLLQELLNYKNNKLSVFALLHKDRTCPGKLFIRMANGSFVHKENGMLWSIPILGLSGRGLDFNHSNGHTPCGVYTIDSVMPEANRFDDFGKFRRLIVNFIAASSNEEVLKSFLPKGHHHKNWWQQSLVAREMGRSLLRIHGTGTVNKKPLSPYFPMIPTSGCLATREVNILGLWQNNDQRELLDTMMQAQGLDKSYTNESKIHGLLYVVEFDGKYQALEFK